MSKKRFYIAPCILRNVKREPAAALLAGSVVTPTTKIRSAGQDLDSHSFDESTYNHTWE